MNEPHQISAPPPATTRDKWSAVAWLGAVAAIAYAPMWGGSVLFFRDIFRSSYPFRQYMKATVLRGELPVWNPDLGLGMSAFADPLWSHFYPPNWLYLVGPLPWMLTFVHFLHVLWGGLGTIVLARRFGARGTVAGIAWSLAGFTTSSLTVGFVESGSWIPWFGVGSIVLAEALAGSDRRAQAHGLAAAAAPVALEGLHGEAFVAIFGVIFGALAALAWLWARGGLRRTLVRFLAVAAVAATLGGMAASVTLLPATFNLKNTNRASPLPEAEAEERSLSPGRLAELAAPWALGDPYLEYPGARLLGFGPDYRPLAYSVYAGSTVLALALLALGRGRRAAAAAAGIALLGLALALGRYLPVHHVLRTLMPPLAHMRHPEKYLTLFEAMLAVLAALGADRLSNATGSRPAWRRTLALALALLAAAIASLIFFEPALATTMSQGLLMGALGVGAVLLCQGLAACGLRVAAPLLMVFVAVDLLVPTWKLNEMAPPEVMTVPPRAVRAVNQSATRRRDAAMPRLYRSDAIDMSVGRFVVAHSLAQVERREIETLQQNTSAFSGLAPINAYEVVPVTLGKLREQAPDKLRWLRALAVDYALMPVSNPNAPASARPGLTPVMDPLPGARLFQVERPLPRAFVAARAEILPDEAATARVFSDQALEGTTVVLAPQPGLALPEVPARRAGDCRLDELTNGRLRAACSASVDGYAVFIEQFADGWSARVDGQPTQILRANLVGRAVRIPAGQHTVEMSYRVPGLATGAALSLVGWLVILACAALRTGRKKGAVAQSHPCP